MNKFGSTPVVGVNDRKLGVSEEQLQDAWMVSVFVDSFAELLVEFLIVIADRINSSFNNRACDLNTR